LHSVRAATGLLVCVAFCSALPALDAQVVRGVVRAGSTLMPVDLATVSARDKAGNLLGSTTTDPLGGYQLDLRTDLAFSLHVRRLGYLVGAADVKALAAADTVDFEFLLEEVALAGEAVVVTGEAGLNDRRLEEANRRGWKVYEPELVMRHRDRASDFVQLLQSMGNPGLILPRSVSDCVRATRNNRCLTYVVDNQVLGTLALIQPSDVYFFAVLGASEARIQFGDRAPYGAIVVYTRSRLDRVQPPRRPPAKPRAPPPATKPVTPPPVD
jgi:hypothetical protein